MNSAKILPVLMIASVLFISGCTAQQQTGTTASSGSGEGLIGNDVGNKAPEFTVTTTDGRTLKLSELTAQNKPIMLYFMATWCPFCSKEYEEISQVYPQYADKLELISVDLDLTENALVLERYRVSKNRPGTFAIGNQQMLIDYDVVSTTTKYAISKDGVILYKSSGVQPAKNWKIIFDALAEN